MSNWNDAEAPATGLDCGTFVRWAARLSLSAPAPVVNREQLGWDTTGIVADALGARRFFEKLGEPRPGCFIVYPDYTAVAKVTGVSTRHDGHIGIVSRLWQEGGRTRLNAIHCSRLVQGMRANLVGGRPDALIESDEVWFPVFKPIFVWCRSIAP